MNRNSLMLGLVATSLTLTSLALLGGAQALGFKSKAYPYTLNVPDDWQSRSVPNVDVAFAAPAASGQVPISFNVAVKPLPPALKVTPDDLLALMLKQGAEAIKDFKQVSVTGVRVGGLPGVELSFTGTEQVSTGQVSTGQGKAAQTAPLQSVPMQWVQRIIIQNNLAYILTYGATQSAFATNPRLARQVLDNFRLTGK
ncbi:hypothetical protein [Deinococcus sp.]|uniref:hypothetical protein n=1 Tax=Deinococcus sp. TaxID=47478 RepID=UPI0025E36DE1|nr:hypothetical protein [Deinococcus sp.]